MKKTIFTIFGLFAFSLVWGQANQNQSFGTIFNGFNSPSTLGQQFSGQEIFRFRSGLVTQLDAGNNFDLSSTSPLDSRWFSIGSLNTGSQTVYGLRFQDRKKALTFGYNNISNPNPRIQWIGTDEDLGNLEFRVADSFSSTSSKLVATMRNDARIEIADHGQLPNTYSNLTPYSDLTYKVGINNEDEETGLYIQSSGTNFGVCIGVDVIQKSGKFNNYSFVGLASDGSDENIGAKLDAESGEDAFGVFARARNGNSNSIGVLGIGFNSPEQNFGIIGVANNTGNVNLAGFFDGDVLATGTITQSSDSKLKENVKTEVGALEKINQLRPVNYNFKKMREINLTSGLSHGFIAKELETVFPELVKNSKKPVLDENGKITKETFEYKTVNYTGMISILTASIQELHQEVKDLKEELSEYKANEILRKSLEAETNKSGFMMEQNIPNPFDNQTSIRYQLPTGVNQASISVFDLNGRLVKDFSIKQNSGELTIKASDIGRGMFLYSLNQNGQEMMTKKMMIK